MVKSEKVRYCCRCGYKWKPSDKRHPLSCPHCRSYDWDTPRFYGDADRRAMAW